MSSHEGGSTDAFRPSAGLARPQVPDSTLRVDRLQVERKTFIFALKQNPRGRFVRITEDVSGHRDSIIVPVSGLADMRRLLEQYEQEGEGAPAEPAAVSG